MARIRTIKPEFWKHEQLSALPEPTHMLAASLLNYADDEGYFNANPKLIQAECSPLREPSVSIHESLILLEKIGYIERRDSEDGRSLGRIVKFTEHQNINRATRSKIKGLYDSSDCSSVTHPQLTEPSSLEQGTGNREQGNNNGDEYAADFLTFWDEWPEGFGSKGAKSQAYTEWKKLRGKPTNSALLAAVHEQFSEKCAARDSGAKFVEPFKHVCRWIKHREWERESLPLPAVVGEAYR